MKQLFATRPFPGPISRPLNVIEKPRMSSASRSYCTRKEQPSEREFFIDNLLVRIHRCFWCTDLAPWEFESPFPGSLISTFLESIPTRLPCVTPTEAVSEQDPSTNNVS